MHVDAARVLYGVQQRSKNADLPRSYSTWIARYDGRTLDFVDRLRLTLWLLGCTRLHPLQLEVSGTRFPLASSSVGLLCERYCYLLSMIYNPRHLNFWGHFYFGRGGFVYMTEKGLYRHL